MRREMAAVLVAACIAVLLSCAGGSPEGAGTAAQESGAQASASSGIVADRFELRWEVDGADLLLAIDTDLPDKAELSVSVTRTYFEVGSETAYSRQYFSEFEPAARWRQPRRIQLDAEAWKADLASFQNEMAALGSDFAFEVDRIEDEVRIRAGLHLNQPDPRFGGRGNPNLSGSATSRSGSDVLIAAEESFTFTLEGPPPARSSTRVSYDGLTEGETYRLSKQTPLMPEFEPSDAIAALGRVIELPAGSMVRVVGTADQRGNSWYEVVLVDDESTTGWINSIALMGQEIERAQ